ncbi:MAG: methyl-accepting chemotaxis protein [Pseudomonadota bacterium]
MSNMKVGTKIILGFIILLMIAVALGGMAIWQMNGAAHISEGLAQKYVPEVEMVNNLERRALLTMYAFRGFGLSEDKAFLEEGRRELAEVHKYVQAGKEHAAKYEELVQLRANIVVADDKAKEYEQVGVETENRTDAIQDARTQLDASAATFMKNSYDFLEAMNDQLAQEIEADVEAAKLKERVNKINLINELVDMGNNTRVAVFKSQALRNPKIIQDAFANFEKMKGIVDQLKVITRQEANIKQLNEVTAAANAYQAAAESLRDNWLALQAANDKRTAVGNEVLKAAQDTAQAALDATSRMSKESESGLSMANTIMMIGLLLAVVIGLGAALFITRSITGPLNRAIEGLSEGSDQVTSASNQVSSASQELAEGASEQAAAVEETSSSLEEMASMTRQNADNAGQANSLMDQAKVTVDRAVGSMKQLTSAMGEISTSGQEIGKIIKTIDEIAFQTNLLALNAAVEAARAGEAGMGFAVVADEVRNLAQRAADAAKNTAELIEGTINKIGQGTELVKTTGDAFIEVADNSKKVAELVGEIAAASAEQAQGIDQVNQAMSQMDSVTQKNAANAEETASASEELNAQAESMRDIVAELEAMVGGTAKAMARAVRSQKAAAVKPRAQAARKPQTKALPASAGSHGRQPAKNATPQQRSKKEIKADEVIPMDDDFGDF